MFHLPITVGMDWEQRVKLITDMGLVNFIAYVSSVSTMSDDDLEFMLGASAFKKFRFRC